MTGAGWGGYNYYNMTLAEIKNTYYKTLLENEETTFVNTLDDFIVNAEERLFHLIQLVFF